MAYLTPPTKLICPTCGFEGHIVVVVGVGPGSRRGDIPQRYFNESGPFAKGRTEDGIGTLNCPKDGTLLWTNKRGARAYGPLTMKEMQGIHGRKWLVPGTENPFPPKIPRIDPRDPFSGKPPPRPRPIKHR
ncbi:hypothetical protein [Roseovarius sp. 2305UL8-3]|uniref:hypothetical protein n=1 Tax=Roseovarius conchicola TaxID=3121636 RepID=UPI003529073F